MYRAVNDNNYPPQNVNAANLAGVLWYLQHEVVTVTPRKFGITRIVRMRVETKAPQPLLDKGMNFGVRFAFDSGMCTGPFDCNDAWGKYGYFVGCNNLGDFPYPTFKVSYPGAVWYSLPGPCPSSRYQQQTDECRALQPGGACAGTPTGRGDCTYSYTMAGEIDISDLEGSNATQFWERADDGQRCQGRISAARELFRLRYPKDPPDEALPAPACDFNYGSFYS